MVLPVQGVAHLNGDQHRQSHGHRWGRLEHVTVNASKILVLLAALHEVRLRGGMKKKILSSHTALIFKQYLNNFGKTESC